MKKLLIGLLAVGSISTFASDCNFLVKSESLAKNKISKMLSEKGYKEVSTIEEADLVVKIANEYSSYNGDNTRHIHVNDITQNKQVFSAQVSACHDCFSIANLGVNRTLVKAAAQAIKNCPL